MNSSKTGNKYGLKLTLFLDTEEYIGLLAPNAAARVLVHDSRIKPNMLSESSVVAPGETTFLSGLFRFPN